MSEYDELIVRLSYFPTRLMEDASSAIRAQAKRIAELSGDLAIEKGFHERDMQLLEQAQSRLAAIGAYRGEAEKVAEQIAANMTPDMPSGAICDALLAARMEGAEAEREALPTLLAELFYERSRQETGGQTSWKDQDAETKSRWIASANDSLDAIRARGEKP